MPEQVIFLGEKMRLKRILSCMLAAVLLFVFLPISAHAATYSGTCGDALTWEFSSETGVLIIDGSGAMTEWSKTVSPWYEYRTYITEVYIADGVTNIGSHAFSYCPEMTSIRIPSSVTSIGSYALNGCESLTDIRLPSSVTFIGSGALYGCTGLKSLEIPSGVTSIEAFTFSYCSGLTSVSLPSGISRIGSWAFGYCSGLTHMTVPAGVTYIDMCTFYDCASLTSVCIPLGVSTIDVSAFYQCQAMTDLYYGGSESDWDEVQIGSGNEYLINTGRHYNYIDIYKATSSRLDTMTNETAITVYENKNDSGCRYDKYVLSEGAAIISDGLIYTTEENGIVKIPSCSSGSIIIEKDGFVSRQISAEQLNKSQRIYLQPVSNGEPVVSAVWIGNIDVRNQNYAVGMLTGSPVTLSAEVDWGDSTYGSIALMQNSKTVLFTGTILTTVLGDNFDVSEDIYIVAMDAAGNFTKKALKFESGTFSALPDFLDGISFEASDKISITLPDTVKPEFFAGTNIKVGVSTIVPVTISAEDGKVYVAIGVDLINYEKSEKEPEGKVKTFVDMFKDTGILDTEGAASSIKKLNNLKETYKTVLGNAKGSFGFDADFTILGFAEGYVDSVGHVTFLDSGMIFNPSISVNYNLPFAIGPVPMFFEASLKAKIEAQLNLLFNETAKSFTPNGECAGTISLSLGVGAGLKKVLYLSGGGEGNLKPVYHWYKDAPDYFKLSASANFYAKAGVAFWEYKISSNSLEAVWCEYPETPFDLQASLMCTEEFYNTTNYIMKDLSYLDQGAFFVANGESDGTVSLLSSTSNQAYLTTDEIKTNIYRESTPQYLDIGDGTRIAVWLDAETNDINSACLYYSYYDGTTWGSPALVNNDGTTDYAPSLVMVGETPYLVWQNANKTFDETDTLDSVAPYFDISVAKFNAESGFLTTTFAIEGLDMSPVVCGDGSRVYVAWVNNSENDWFGDNTCNSIICCQYDGETWLSPETAYNSLYSVDALSADYNADLKLAYCMDSDGNLATSDDVRLYENGVRVTASDTMETNPVYANHTLYWNSGGTVICSETEVQETVFDVGKYQVVEGGGEKALIYTTSNGLCSTLNASFYNTESKQWCEPYELTDGTTFIGAFSAAMSSDGTLRVLVNSKDVIGTYSDDDPYGTAALLLITLEKYCDLTMGELLYSNDMYDAGNAMKFTFDLKNNGLQTINSVTIVLTDESSNVLSSITRDVLIAPGQTIATSTYFDIDASASGQKIKIVVAPDSLSDINIADNYQEADLFFEDLCVENASSGEKSDGEKVISANIINYGYTIRENIVVELHEESADGNIVDTVTISALDPLALEIVTFDILTQNSDVYYVVVKDSGDAFAVNDSDFVALLSVPDPDFVAVDGISNDRVQLYFSNDKAGICIAVIYDINGRMLTSGISTVGANAGEVTIIYAPFANVDSYKLKVFFLNLSQAPVYECISREYSS
jgi:hypothetical protein